MLQIPKPTIIRTRDRSAGFAFIAAYLAFNRWRQLSTIHSSGVPGWPFPFGSMYPNWVAEVLNLSLYGILIWFLILAFRRLRGGERLFFAAWILAFLLYPVKGLVSPSVAIALVWAQLIANVIMVAASISIYRALPSKKSQEQDTGHEPANSPLARP